MTFALSRRPWLAVVAVIALWALEPELRRIIDWRSGFAAISLLSILPLLALGAAAVPLLYGGALRRADPVLVALAWVWLGGFTFALAIGALSGSGLAPALYAYVEFVLPMVFGVWVATRDADARELHDRVAAFMLGLGTVLTIYAAFQFVRPPAWDVRWMLDAHITSIGVPLPYQFRPFSTLNGPGIFADFLVATILLNVPRLRAHGPFVLLQTAVCGGGLLLTMVRSDWIAIGAGAVVAILLSPHRLRNLTLFSGVALACTVLALNLATLLGSGAESGLQNRFATFSNLNADVSYNERARYFGEPLAAALRNPAGEGLGVVGTAAKLGDLGRTRDFDDGYIARFTEMGYFGTACYLAVVALAFGWTVRRARHALRRGATDLAAIAASSAAVQAALIVLDVSSDHHNALGGLLFWLAIALPRDAA